jgi:transposase
MKVVVTAKVTLTEGVEVFFACHSCGHTLNADLNGAQNIVRRYMRITGLDCGKHAHVVACDEVETLLQGRD